MHGAVSLCVKMTQLLLEKGATINTFDKKDRRAVHWAAYMGHVDIVRLLVSFGAELGCRDKQVCCVILCFLCFSLYHVLCCCIIIHTVSQKTVLFVSVRNLSNFH